MRDLLAALEQKDVERVKVTSELENRYEHKLADQVRYGWWLSFVPASTTMNDV